ncbi:MAG: monooxygenase [Actinomycetia bacterium]|nr:monooxygenase [Actinomycetes bacterium]
MKPLHAIIVGAGIGGLTAAVALRRDGHSVTVLDQTRELRPAGAGISLWSNGVKVLNALGLGDAIAAVGGRMDWVSYLDRDGKQLCHFSLDPLVERVAQRPYPVRRTDLQNLLLDAVGVEHVLLGQRCVKVDDDGDGVIVATESGDRFGADLVIAADGANSRLRSYVVGHGTEREYLGYQNWNGLVRRSLGGPDEWTVFLGEAKRVSTMPVRDGFYFFFDVPLDDPDIDATRPAPDVLAEHFDGWAPAVQDLIANIDPATTTNVAIHTHTPLGRFSRGRVAIMGDAAHTTAPDLGQGGCQAMEDALVLARSLRDTRAGVVEALERYSAERVPRTEQIIVRAADRARVTHGHDPLETEAWYRELATEDGSRIIEGICRSIESGPLA